MTNRPQALPTLSVLNITEAARVQLGRCRAPRDGPWSGRSTSSRERAEGPPAFWDRRERSESCPFRAAFWNRTSTARQLRFSPLFLPFLSSPLHRQFRATEPCPVVPSLFRRTTSENVPFLDRV